MLVWAAPKGGLGPGAKRKTGIGGGAGKGKGGGGRNGAVNKVGTYTTKLEHKASSSGKHKSDGKGADNTMAAEKREDEEEWEEEEAVSDSEWDDVDEALENSNEEEEEDLEEDYVFDPKDFTKLKEHFGDEFGFDDVGGSDYKGEDATEVEYWYGQDHEEMAGSGDEDDGGVGMEVRPKAAKVPVVAVIGRPNVGKSTIVNRVSKTMSKDPDAIVYDYEGVTRDRIYRR